MSIVMVDLTQWIINTAGWVEGFINALPTLIEEFAVELGLIKIAAEFFYLSVISMMIAEVTLMTPGPQYFSPIRCASCSHNMGCYFLERNDCFIPADWRLKRSRVPLGVDDCIYCVCVPWYIWIDGYTV